MTRPLTILLQDLDSKISQLEASKISQQKQIAKLTEENRNLKADLENTRRELAQSKTEAEFLTMSHRLADSPDSIISTRRRIARLIRTIDKCISMLKEE